MKSRGYFYSKTVPSSLIEVKSILFTFVSLGLHTHYVFNLCVLTERTRKCRCALPYFSLCFSTAWINYRISCPVGSQTFGEGAHLVRRIQVSAVYSFPPIQRATTRRFPFALEAHLCIARTTWRRPQPPARPAEPRPNRWARGRGAGAR